MYDKILVPTDGSSTAEAAFEHAIELARQYDAEILALYVVDTDAMSITLGPEQVDRVMTGQFEGMGEVKEEAEAALERVEAIADERRVECDTEIRAGTPHKKIGDCIDDSDIDVVVMGSHGRGGLKRRIMGSVTERVLRSTTVPVLVIDEKGETEEEDEKRAEKPAL